MIMYFATGFPIMNKKGREQEIRDRFGMNRLFSFADQNGEGGFRARVIRSLEVYTGHIYSGREESEL